MTTEHEHLPGQTKHTTLQRWKAACRAARPSNLVQIAVIALLAVMLGIYMTNRLGADICMRLYVDQKFAGYVHSPAAVQSAMDRILAEQGSTGSHVLEIDTRYTLCLREDGQELLDSDDCFALLSGYITHTYTQAYALLCNGTTVANLATREEAEEIISRLDLVLQESILGKEEGITNVHINASYAVNEVTCEKRTLQDAEAVYSMLYASFENQLLGTDTEPAPDEAPEDETPVTESVSGNRINAFVNDSAYLYDAYHTIDVLRNSTVHTVMSDEVQSMLSKIELSYQTEHSEITSELIPYETVYIESEDHYVGYTNVEVEGENGLREIVYLVSGLAGEEISREITSTRVITEPVHAVITVGTKPYPKPIPTGTYVWPVQQFVITSQFGWRKDPYTGERKYHNGLDLAANKDTPIYAIDGGTVTYAGYKDSYGLLVIIDHGNGLTSYYAHQNQILVKKGDLVYQGQQIGKIGKTGRATGYHLHLEVRVNGIRKDPEDYLPKRRK